MRASNLLTAAIFVAAAAAALAAASSSVTLVEEQSEIDVRHAFDAAELSWAEVEAQGMQVMISGTAPSEAFRFQALSTAGSVIDATRLVDNMETKAVADLAAPRFSAELLRNSSGLSIIGLVPASTDRETLIAGLQAQLEVPVTELLETADYPAPSGWGDALAFALSAAESLPRSKISVDAGRVEITAIANSKEERDALEAKLRGSAPPAMQVALEISAPRPVITPFTLRFVMDEAGVRFDTCAADTEAARSKILDAAFRAGLTGVGRCILGMGVPSTAWADAASIAITALADLGGGSVTMSDTDIALTAAPGTNPRLYDRVIGELENALPEVFALDAVLPELETPETGPTEFIATLSPEGLVQMRGRLPNTRMRQITASFAQAKFGSSNVHMAARLDSDLPAIWPDKVLAGLDAMGYLESGSLTVVPGGLKIAGRSNREDAGDVVARLMADKLGPAARIDIDVAYVAPLPPTDIPPTPEECEAELAGIVSVAKINFEPSSATIDAEAVATMDDIAEVLADCGDLKLEIQGHTDSQGREEMNLALSQSRAESVLNELRARKVLTANFSAKGYGEEFPIADNATEEGREANRRIEFKLILPEPLAAETKTTLESVAENGDTEDVAADAASSQEAE